MTREEEWLLREKYHGEKTEGFFADCNHLKKGEPLAYLIGNVPFLNCVIYLDSRPLIPRPETEYWVSVALEEIKTSPNPEPKVLDLCAGSGCVGVAVLKGVPNAQVDFVEIEEKHHPTIEKNIVMNDIEKTRATILGGDLFEKVEKKYDFILTNPPYIDPALDRTESSVREYEPPEALWGGVGGLSCISRIFENAPRFLTPHGVLYLEHEPEQVPYIKKLATAEHFEIEFFPDQFGIIRYTRAQH